MRTIDISGLGGSYEAGCQKMLLNGLRYLKRHPNFDFSVYKTYKGIYGICEGEGREAEALDKAINKGVDSTGAMHQAVISHLAYIHKNGYEKWITEAETQGHKIYERQDEKDLNTIIQKANEEWKAKLDAGYDPFEGIPKENIISVDMEDTESIRRATEDIASIVKQGK